jgi:hypothetical protein
MKRGKAKDTKKTLQDDEQPVRAKVREIAEGSLVTIVMMSVTIFALVGDDFR